MKTFVVLVGIIPNNFIIYRNEMKYIDTTLIVSLPKMECSI